MDLQSRDPVANPEGQRMLEAELGHTAPHQIIFVYTARHNAVFHDFVTGVFWRKTASGHGEVSKEEKR
jgi:hypothetical protein